MDLNKKEEREGIFDEKVSRSLIFVIAVCSILYILFLVWMNFARYQKGYNIHDIFIFENSFWNTLQGRIFWNFYEFGNHLGVHFSPGLFLLLPFYALVPKAHTLLFLQSLSIALAGIPLFALSRRILKDDVSSFLVVLSYWFYAPTLGTAFSGFHETPFVLPFIFAFFWAWESRRKKLFRVFIVLSLIWKETFALMFLFLGISFLVRSQTRKTGLHLIILSLAWIIWSFFIIMPLLRGVPISSSLIRYRFPKEIGHSFQEIIINFFKNPGFFIRFAFQSEKAFYLLQLLIPILFLPFLNPLFLLPILPQLGENLLSRYLFGASLLKHYSASLIPFLFYAGIKAIPRFRALLKKKEVNTKRFQRCVALCVLLLCLLMIFPSEVYIHILKAGRTKDESLHYLSPGELEAARNMGNMVPQDASFAVSGHLAKYFARRKVICFISVGFLRIFPFDYLLFYAPSKDKDILNIHQDLDLLMKKNYELVDRKGRLYLFKRRSLDYSDEQLKILEGIPE